MPSLLQMLIPTRDKELHLFGPDEFSRVRRELTDQFGGVTAYSRAPAEGDPGKGVERDDIVVIEVVVERIDTEWWESISRTARDKFQQDRILYARAQLPNTLGGRPVGLYYRPQ